MTLREVHLFKCQARVALIRGGFGSLAGVSASCGGGRWCGFPGFDRFYWSFWECGGPAATRRQQFVRPAQALAGARQFHFQRVRLFVGFEGGRLPVGHFILQLPEQLAHLAEQAMIRALTLHRCQQGPAGLGYVGETASLQGQRARGARRAYLLKVAVLDLELDRRTFKRSVAEGASIAGWE